MDNPTEQVSQSSIDSHPTSSSRSVQLKGHNIEIDSSYDGHVIIEGHNVRVIPNQTTQTTNIANTQNEPSTSSQAIITQRSIIQPSSPNMITQNEDMFMPSQPSQGIYPYGISSQLLLALLDVFKSKTLLNFNDLITMNNEEEILLKKQTYITKFLEKVQM